MTIRLAYIQTHDVQANHIRTGNLHPKKTLNLLSIKQTRINIKLKIKKIEMVN